VTHGIVRLIVTRSLLDIRQVEHMASSNQLGPEDNGRRIAVSVGDTVTVRLPERRTAGFRWQSEVDPAVLLLVEDHYEPPGDRPGAPGTHQFTFQVQRAGTTVVRLVSGRSWSSRGRGSEYVVDLSVAAGPGG
jgi:predicted secreted protein